MQQVLRMHVSLALTKGALLQGQNCLAEGMSLLEGDYCIDDASSPAWILELSSYSQNAKHANTGIFSPTAVKWLYSHNRGHLRTYIVPVCAKMLPYDYKPDVAVLVLPRLHSVASY